MLVDDKQAREKIGQNTKFVSGDVARELEVQVESLSAQVAESEKIICEHLSRAMAAEAQVAELKKDAERYLRYMPGFRKCEFCGCLTNAKLRACCNQGRTADLDAAKESGP